VTFIFKKFNLIYKIILDPISNTAAEGSPREPSSTAALASVEDKAFLA
jgi:hypothetical protein